MLRKGVLIGTVVVLALALGLTLGTALGQDGGAGGGERIIASETEGDNQRVISGPSAGVSASSPDAVNIGFIDSPTAMCYQPNPAQDVCYINWYYLSVSASPNYMITMTVTLNPRAVSHYQGFFQTSMYAPFNMHGQGFKVACGALGAGGNPVLGNAYAYTIRARDSANLQSANYGTAYCPAYVP
ncbi:MAG: hypothetical protein MUF84_15735 [Anaerolineae bacterium]|jgi:hypothetical protein|nr:hypothetical protein [Anaerolineae bacterium]